jgi:hypothetical protein
MRPMDHAVADRIRDAGLANGGVPRGRRQLAGNERRGAFAPVLHDLQEVPAFCIGERREEPIINRQEIELGVFRQVPGIRSIAATDGKLVQEPRRPDVGRREAMATRALHECRRQPWLPDPGRARDQEIGVIPNSSARTETEDDLTVQPTRRREIDIFERRRIPELGLPQALRESAQVVD